MDRVAKIKDYSEKIFKLSKELTSSQKDGSYNENLMLIKSLSENNIEEINILLGYGGK